jgi:hypothetical protein
MKNRSILFFFGILITFNVSSQSRAGKDFALFIVNEKYKEPSWRTLSSPLKDATEIAKDLRDLYGFQTQIVKNPSRKEILDTLISYKLRHKFPSEDGQLLIYFSGHGHYDDLALEGYFIPQDGRSSNDDPYGDSWLSYSELRKRVSGIDCRHILLVMDACYSGAIDPKIFNKNETGDSDMDRPGEAAKARNQRISDLLRPRSRIFITSGDKNYTPDPSEVAAQFKAGLRSLGGSIGYLSAQKLFDNYLEKANPSPKLGSFEKDEISSTFLFVYKYYKAPNLIPTAVDKDGDGFPDVTDVCPSEPGSAQGCPDTDQDGVADKDDKCPNVKGILSQQGCLGDEDNDGFADDIDECPNLFGHIKGCPDRDHDGISDKYDKCPDTSGAFILNGCPDTDGDGIPDIDDRCPKQKGEIMGCPDTDGDGISDIEDRCPGRKGEIMGCPDTDGDGVPDIDDRCSKLKGEINGCPDTDGDRVPDIDDLCPKLSGVLELRGCPVDDRDGDGVKNQDDRCPEENGQKQMNGCPDSDGDDIVDLDDRCPKEKGSINRMGCPLLRGWYYANFRFDPYQYFKIPSSFYPSEADHTVGSLGAFSGNIGAQVRPINNFWVGVEAGAGFSPWGLSLKNYRGLGIAYFPVLINTELFFNNISVGVASGYEWVIPDLYGHTDKRPVVTKAYGNFLIRLQILHDDYDGYLGGNVRWNMKDKSWGFGILLPILFNSEFGNSANIR